MAFSAIGRAMARMENKLADKMWPPAFPRAVVASTAMGRQAFGGFDGEPTNPPTRIGVEAEGLGSREERFPYSSSSPSTWSMRLMAVPKHKVSRYKKGLRNGPKALKPVPVIIRCKSCGRVKLPHFFCCSGDRGTGERTESAR